MKHLDILLTVLVAFIIVTFLFAISFIIVKEIKDCSEKHKTSYQLKDMGNNIYSNFKPEIDTFINGDTNDTLFIIVYPKDTFYIDAFADHIDTVIKLDRKSVV